MAQASRGGRALSGRLDEVAAPRNGCGDRHLHARLSFIPLAASSACRPHGCRALADIHLPPTSGDQIRRRDRGQPIRLQGARV